MQGASRGEPSSQRPFGDFTIPKIDVDTNCRIGVDELMIEV